MSVVSPTPGLMGHLPSSPITMSGSPSIKTEHLALIGFAARLGSSMTSDAVEATKTREDAQLLLSLLHPKSLLYHKDTDAADGSKQAKHSHCNGGSGSKGNEFTFSFTCPSLSIDADRDRTKEAMLTLRECSEKVDGECSHDCSPLPSPPRPSQLFRRSVSVNDRDGVKDAVESVARNVMQSFSVALEWRCRAWIDSLSKVLLLKESLMAHQYSEEVLEEEEQEDEQEDEQEGEEEVWEEEAADETSVGEDSDDSSEQEQEPEDQDAFYYSKEMTVIDALARVISDLSVRDVKTSFRVLPQVMEKEAKKVKPSRVTGSSAPPPKKRIRIRQVTVEDDSVPKDARLQHQLTSHNKGQYEIAHGILFEATMTVSSGAEERQVTLTAPGSITGTFVNASGGEGEEVLMGVTVILDTDVLALSMERNSRLVVRKAAEACMFTTSVQPSYEEYTYSSDVPEMSATAYADMYPQAAVVTPKQGTSPPTPFSSGGSDGDITEDLTIPPSAICLNFGSDDDSAPPKTVSPTQMSESDASWCLFSPKSTTKSVMPSLVSPSPTHTSHEEEMPHAEESEWYSFRSKRDRTDCPSLPALVEVACAAMCATTN